MIQGDIIVPITGASFNNYWYLGVLVPNGVSVTIDGNTIPSMSAPIIIPVGISGPGSISSSGGDAFLIGRKKFGLTSGTTFGYWENPLSNDSGNADGTFSIR